MIDANPVSRSVLVSQLRDQGVEHVRQTGRVNDARLWLEERPYDIVLCDYHFEESAMSGQDLLDELQSEGLLPHATVFIMVTGEASHAKVMEAAESALDGYLLKPYTCAALADRLTEARKRKRSLRNIFDALQNQQTDLATTLRMQRFAKREPYAQFAAPGHRAVAARQPPRRCQTDRHGRPGRTPPPRGLAGRRRTAKPGGAVAAALRSAHHPHCRHAPRRTLTRWLDLAGLAAALDAVRSSSLPGFSLLPGLD